MSNDATHSAQHAEPAAEPTDPCSSEWIDEIAVLKRRMRDEESPGASLILKHMTSLEPSFKKLIEDVCRFNPASHKRNYNADAITRRFIYLQANQYMTTLIEAAVVIGKTIEPFNLDKNNTQVPKENKYRKILIDHNRREKLTRERNERVERVIRRNKARALVMSPSAPQSEQQVSGLGNGGKAEKTASRE